MLRLIHNQTVSGSLLINDIDDGLPNKTARRGVARNKITGDPLSTVLQTGVGDTISGPFSGTGDSLTFLLGVVTLVDAGASFVVGDVGKKITISGATNPGNNGVFTILSRTGSTTITLWNPSGVTETSSFTYRANEVSLVDSAGLFAPQNVGESVLVSGASNAGNNGRFQIVTVLNGTTVIFVNSAGVTETSSFNYSLVCGIPNSHSYQRDGSLGGVDRSTSPGVNYPKQKCYIPRYKILSANPLTYDTSVAGYIDLFESDRVLMSQSKGVIFGLAQSGDLVGIGDLTFSTPTVTLTDSGAGFLATDLGKHVEIIGAANPTNNGSFAITSVVSATAVEYSNALGVAESSVNYEIARGASLITAVSFTESDVTPPKITGAVIDSPSAGILRISGTGLTSLEPEITRVTITGATTVTVTQAQIIAAGGSISATQIDVPASLLPVITAGSSVALVTSDGSSNSVDLLTTTGWTSTNWTGSYNAFTHVTGNTTALTNTLAAVVGVIYTISVTITGRTTGTVTVTFGGVAGSAISTSTTTSIAATSTGTLSIAPSTSFDGTVAISIGTAASVVTSLVANPAVTTATLRRGAAATTALTFLTPDVTLIDSAASFVAGDVGKSIKISGAATPGNNGTFVIASRVDGNTITYVNASGAPEPADYTLELDIVGTGMASSAPNLTSVIITGAGAVTLTQTQILAVTGGVVSATSIVVPVTLIPSVAPTTSSVQIRAHNQLSTPVTAVI